MAQKLYAIYSLKYYIEFFMKTQKNYMQTFIYSNFNYSLVVWHFSSAATNKKNWVNSKTSIKVSVWKPLLVATQSFLRKGTMEIKRLQLIFQYSKPFQKKAKNLQIENIVTKTLSKYKIFYWAQKYGTYFQNI